MYQSPNETLKEWLASYNKEVAIIRNCSEEACLLDAISSMSTDIPFRSDLDAKPPQTRKEFLNRATKFIAEEARILCNRRPKSVIISGGESSDRKKRPANNDSRESSDKKQKSGNEDKCPQSFNRFETYTELNTRIEDIYYNIWHWDLLRRPQLKKKDLARRNQSKYCNFHREVNHLTSECNDLNDEIDDLIRRGYLKEYNKENKKGRVDHRRNNRGDCWDDQRNDKCISD